MLSTLEIKERLKSIKPTLQKEFFVKSIGLFGSYSNGTYTNDSDIDILVELEKPIGWNFFKLENYLENTFNRKVDLVTKNALKKPLQQSILNKVQYI
jgi:predicted nucleotidyltransferase